MKPEAPALYHDVENNTLLNDVFFYVLHHLPQLQNMHEYMVPAQDIDGAEGDIVDVPAGEAVHPKASPCLGMKRRRNLLPLPPPLLLPLPQLPSAAAMARDRLQLVGRSMPE